MEKLLSLEIFGRFLFESDAVEWLKLCKDKKRDWILKHTEQKDESLITEFINNPNISKDCKCLDCGKTKKDGNISRTVSKKASAPAKFISRSKPDRKDSSKGQTSPEE